MFPSLSILNAYCAIYHYGYPYVSTHHLYLCLYI